MLRRLFVCLLFIICTGSLPAQPKQQFIFAHIDARNGLASDNVRDLLQDKKGFIWIATMNGLQRYDGSRFITLRHREGDPSTIASNRIYSIQLDKKDRLWIHCGENKVGYLDINTLIFHEVAVRIEEDFIKTDAAALFVGNDGNILFAVYKRLIVTFNEAANEFAEKYNFFTLPPRWTPYGIYPDSLHHNYWIATDSGLLKYNQRTKKITYKGHNEENDPIINALGSLTHIAHPYYDRSGRFWVQRWTEKEGGPYIYSVDTRTGTTKQWGTLYNSVRGKYHEIRSLFEQDDGSIWITGLNIMAYLLPSASQFESIYGDTGGESAIRYDIIENLFQDREKNIWVCTDKGIYRFNPSAQLFTVLNNYRPGKDSAYTSDVTDILQTREGNILVSTWGNGTFTYNKNLSPISMPGIQPWPGQQDIFTWALLERSNGDIWRLCQGGFIYITSAQTKTTQQLHPFVFGNATIRQAVEDKKGNVWLGSHAGHLVKWDATTHRFELVLKTGTVYRLLCDRKGEIWVCTGGNGVLRINPENNSVIANYTTNGPAGKRLKNIGAFDIVQYNDSIYIIASECLNLLNIHTGHIDFFSSANGLPADAVENMVVDKDGFLWTNSENYFCRIQLKKSIVSTFFAEDGLAASAYNIASAGMLRDGRIAFGRVHDFVTFNPADIVPGEIPVPQPEITSIYLMNNWVRPDSLQKLKKIEVRYDQSAVRIEFSTFTYLNRFPVLYMLKGLDKEWINAGSAKEVKYNYLPPGDYTFLMKCDNGEVSSAITSIRISVKAPFWQTWWFYCLLALVVAAVFYFLDRERIRRKEAMQKMRGEIAGNLHEEINTALNNINVLSEIARIKADKEPEQSKNYITEIHYKSHNMIIAMDDMLWSIDPANDSMAKTINRIREFADALHHRYGSTIDLQTSEKVLMLNPDMNVRHELMLILKLALRLLVEEFGAKQTAIHLYYIQSQLQLNIFSPGIRLNETNNQVIKSLEEIKERAAAIRATIEIQSDEKGTAIILAVKAR